MDDDSSLHITVLTNHSSALAIIAENYPMRARHLGSG